MRSAISIRSDDPDDTEVLALGLMFVGDGKQRHTGIRFDALDGQPMLLHLAWHHTVAVWTPPSRMRWVPLRGVHPLRVSAIHGQCQLIARHADPMGWASHAPHLSSPFSRRRE